MPQRGKKPAASQRPAQKRAKPAKPAKPKRGETPAISEAHAKRALSGIREQISSVDTRLVELLNERAKLVVSVGQLKRAAGMPIYAPHREAEVIDRAIRASKSAGGPLPDRALEAIYRELMSGSFALQQPLRIGYLGPPGSFSHAAAVRHFGSSVEFEDLRAIEGVFTEVSRGHVNYGLVPIENSTHGGVAETLDAFRSGRHGSHGSGHDGVTICAEVQMEVHHAVLANCAPSAIRRIHSKPEVFSQCRIWLATQYPQAELIPAPSSSRAAQIALEESEAHARAGRSPSSAAIGGELAGQIYGLNVLFANIEDHPGNITRFFVIGRQKADRTGDDKTSIMFSTADKPGALVAVLGAFHEAGINLSHIDKRPSGRVNWTYTFFIDAQGHRDDQAMIDAVASAKSHCRELTVLGSYPRSKRIL